VVARLPAAQ